MFRNNDQSRYCCAGILNIFGYQLGIYIGKLSLTLIKICEELLLKQHVILELEVSILFDALITSERSQIKFFLCVLYCPPVLSSVYFPALCACAAHIAIQINTN